MDRILFKLKVALPVLTMIADTFLDGAILGKIIFAKLRKAIKKTDWIDGQISISSIHCMVLLWFVIGGAI